MNTASLAAWQRGKVKTVSGVWELVSGLTLPLICLYPLVENTSSISLGINYKIVQF